MIPSHLSTRNVAYWEAAQDRAYRDLVAAPLARHAEALAAWREVTGRLDAVRARRERLRAEQCGRPWLRLVEVRHG